MKKVEIVEVVPSHKIVVGEKDAPITMVQFGDYESEACADAHEVVKALLETYPHQVKFIFRHFPLLSIHQKAHKAAEASLAAAQEGMFWPMHNELFANRHSLGVISLKRHARDAGVKSKKFLDELINGFYGLYVQDDLREGKKLGVTEIPTFFFNGKKFEQEPTFDNLSSHIEKLLATVGSKKSKKALEEAVTV
ncbi:DsbA family protein [Aridibaculum aurantiacum]|uniref:DsbA family protein n=1 Tax=Aridibaculum aurantiacum TaxID=2810307 RepID=UPI001A963063|nr:DsbA family protein [Aridibaculum aurantiacum]